VNSLQSLQRFVSDAIRRRSSDLDGELGARVSDLIMPSPRGMSPADRIEIHREQFWLRHVSNLEEDYPTLGRVLGGLAFREVAGDYLHVFPPRGWNLERLGKDLPSFLASARPNPSRLACDAAHLDWAFMEAFAARDVPSFDDRVLATAAEDAWPGAQVRFHPSLQALAMSHAVHSLRESIQRGESQDLPPRSETYVVVWRDPAFYLRSVAIERDAFHLLRALMENVTLGAACERVAASRGEGADVDEIGRHIARWFQEWRANGWLAAVQFA
jgi:hypothetical protein